MSRAENEKDAREAIERAPEGTSVKSLTDYYEVSDALTALNGIDLRGRSEEIRRRTWRARLAVDALRAILDPWRQ